MAYTYGSKQNTFRKIERQKLRTLTFSKITQSSRLESIEECLHTSKILIYFRTKNKCNFIHMHVRLLYTCSNNQKYFFPSWHLLSNFVDIRLRAYIYLCSTSLELHTMTGRQLVDLTIHTRFQVSP